MERHSKSSGGGFVFSLIVLMIAGFSFTGAIGAILMAVFWIVVVATVGGLLACLAPVKAKRK